MNADGSGTENLTRSPKFDDGPAWSPDGQKIAFQRVVGVIPCGTGGCGPAESDIFVMNADGSEQRNLTRKPSLNLGSHAWSPDGQKILFQRRAKRKNWDIYVINADGSGERNLTRNRSHDLDAAWSPDGRRIVFRTSRHGKWELYVMNADGSGQREADAHSGQRVPSFLVARRAEDRVHARGRPQLRALRHERRRDRPAEADAE